MSSWSEEELRKQLSDLNYLYPFSAESRPLVEALLSDLIATVSTYKELEAEHDLSRQEVKLAVDEINRIGVIENPRLIKENGELQLKLVKQAEEVEKEMAAVRRELVGSEERRLKLELSAAQLRFANQTLEQENSDLRARIDQLLVIESERDDRDLASIFVSTPTAAQHLPDIRPNDARDAAGMVELEIIKNLKDENTTLEAVVEELRLTLSQAESRYTSVESKFLSQPSPITFSGTWAGLGNASTVIGELNEKLDFVNSRYIELKRQHSKCRLSPADDLRESRRSSEGMTENVKLVAKLKTENEALQKQISAMQAKPAPVSEKKKPQPAQVDSVQPAVHDVKIAAECDSLRSRCSELEEKVRLQEGLVDESRKQRKQIEVLKRDLKTAQNALALKEKEVKIAKSAAAGMSPSKAGGDVRRLAAEVGVLEEKLRQTTEDRDELIERLGFIENSIEAMEREVVRIETENVELKKDRVRKDESFVGISQQLVQVNELLTSISELGDDRGGDRGLHEVKKLEETIRFKDDQISRLAQTIESVRASHAVEMEELRRTSGSAAGLQKQVADLEALTRSLSASKDQLLHQLKLVQSEINAKRAEVEEVKASAGEGGSVRAQLEGEVGRLKKALTEMDFEKDELQKLCDDQTEKISVLRAEISRVKADMTGKEEEVASARMETDRIRHILDEKEGALGRLEQRLLGMQEALGRKDKEVLARAGETESVRGEMNELVAENRRLAEEVNRMRQQVTAERLGNDRGRAELHSAMESLRLTESERNDVLGLYKQVIDENRNLSSNFHRLTLEIDSVQQLAAMREAEVVRCTRTNEHLSRQCKQAEVDLVMMREQLSELSAQLERVSHAPSAPLALMGIGAEALDSSERNQEFLQRQNLELEKEVARITVNNNALNERVKQLAELVDSEKEKTREMNEYVEALSAVTLGGDAGEGTAANIRSEEVDELKNTIEQQYTLIGEMDSEQARLMVENANLREQLAHAQNS